MTAYGFWLPNDLRGSWSDFVRRRDLLQFGRATKTNARASVAHHTSDFSVRAAARNMLQYPAVTFDGRQAFAIANGFGDVVHRTCCAIFACAVMPDHVHLVVGRHSYDIQQLANLLKGGATARLRKEGLDPLGAFVKPNGRTPSPWSEGLWKVWLDSAEDVQRSIAYTNGNPVRAGLKPQRWRFVQEYR